MGRSLQSSHRRSIMKLLIAFSALAGLAASQNVVCEAPIGFNYVPAKYPVGAKIDLKSVQAKIDKINADIINNNPSIGKGDILDKKALAEKYGDKLKATLETIQEQKKIKLQKKEKEQADQANTVQSLQDKIAAALNGNLPQAAFVPGKLNIAKEVDSLLSNPPQIQARTAEEIKKAAKKAEKKLDRQMEKAAIKAEKKVSKQLKKQNGKNKNKKNKNKKNKDKKNKK